VFQSLEPTFKAWRIFARERLEHKREVMGRMLLRLEQAGLWVSLRADLLDAFHRSPRVSPSRYCSLRCNRVVQRAWRHWKLVAEHERVADMRSQFERFVFHALTTLLTSGPVLSHVFVSQHQ
jgi:hypothetical protein